MSIKVEPPHLSLARLSLQCLRRFHTDGLPSGRDAALRKLIILNIDQPRIVMGLVCRWLVSHPLGENLERLVIGYLRTATRGESRLLVWAAVDLAQRSRDPHAGSFLDTFGTDDTLLHAAACTALTVMLARTDGEPAAVAPPPRVRAFQITWLFAELHSVAIAVGLPEAADRLFQLWSAWEHQGWSAASSLELHPLMFKNIGHALIYSAIRLGQAQGLLPDRRLTVNAPATPDNPVLLELLPPPPDPPGPGSHPTMVRGNMPYRLLNGRTVGTPGLVSETLHRHWSAGGGALLSLTKAQAESAVSALRSAGLDTDRPFVTLHVREMGFDAESARATRTRNARIATYIDGIRRILNAGFGVVRVGDATMERLPPIDGVLDYPFSDAKSHIADLYLVAHCHFHIGTSSGLSLMPLMFDRPVLFTNWLPIGDEVWSRRTLFTYKWLRLLSGERLSLDQARRRSPSLYRIEHLIAAGAVCEDNSPAEIADGVSDMIEFVAAGAVWDAADGPRPAPSFQARQPAGGQPPAGQPPGCQPAGVADAFR